MTVTLLRAPAWRRYLLGATLTVLSLPAAAAESDLPRLISNVRSFREIEEHLETRPLEHNVYNVSFVAYDKGFSDEFGLLPSYVTELDTGLRFFEFRMATEDGDTRCYYNAILDKSVKLDFPEENYISALNFRTPTLPENFDASDETRKKALKFRSNYAGASQPGSQFSNRTYLGNRGYTFHTQGQAFRDGIIGYERPMFIVYAGEYTLVSLGGGGCGTTIWEHPEPALWFRKPGEKETHQPLLKSYYTFAVPPVLVEQIRSAMQTYKPTTETHKKEK